MKAKKTLKFHLHRETLVHLTSQDLTEAIGGKPRQTGPSCQEDCASLPIATCSCSVGC